MIRSGSEMQREKTDINTVMKQPVGITITL